MEYGGQPRGLSVNFDTLALASSIALEGTFFLSGPFGSGISDDDDEDCEGTSLQYFRMPQPAIFNVKSCTIFFHSFQL